MTSSIASMNSDVSFGSISHQSEDNVLKLKLKKPKSWNWELSTSKSSAHIEFPRILLYDTDDKLLADIEEADCVVNGKNSGRSNQAIDKKHRLHKSSSFNVYNSTASTDRLRISYEKSSSPNSERSRSHSIYSHQGYKSKVQKDAIDRPIILLKDDLMHATTKLDDKQPEIPIFIYSARGLVQRDFNAKEFDAIRNCHENRQQNDVTRADLSSTTDQKSNQQPTANLSIDKQTIKPKCLADIAETEVTRKKCRRKIRRSKSVNSSSHKYHSRSTSSSSTSSLSSLSVCEVKTRSNTPNEKTVYHTQKSAAGTIIVPEVRTHNRRTRRRHRSESKSTDKIDQYDKRKNANQTKCDAKRTHQFKSSSGSSKSHEALNCCQSRHDSPSNTIPAKSKRARNRIDELNEKIPLTVNTVPDNGHRIKHLALIKNASTQLEGGKHSESFVNSNKCVNQSSDRKQKKVQLNRKVSFVQFEPTEHSTDSIYDGELQQCDDLNKNSKCNRLSNCKKMFHGKIKKSASVAAFYNKYSIEPASSSDERNAILSVRHNRQRYSQRSKSSTRLRHISGEYFSRRSKFMQSNFHRQFICLTRKALASFFYLN